MTLDVNKRNISIHALREEGDFCCVERCAFGKYFYPRPPRGGRPAGQDHGGNTNRFLSTPSARRATQNRKVAPPHDSISIHALREEGDPSYNIKG